MRTHRSHAVLHEWAAATWQSDRIAPHTLTAARFEPVQRRHLGTGLLDLTFIAGGDVCVVPGLIVDCPQLVSNEADALLWPLPVARFVDDATAEAVEALVKPWLRSLARARTMHRSETRVFASGAAAQIFARAAERGFLGTVAVAELVRAAAPFVYAKRFVSAGARVTVACGDGALAAAILQTERADVRCIATDDDAARWYGISAATTHEGPPDVLVADREGLAAVPRGAHTVVVALDPDSIEGTLVAVAQSAPLDGLLSFDPADGPAIRMFVVAAPLSPARGAVAVARVSGSGSSGRIALATRPDRAVRDGDLDAADALGERMHAEGFDVVRITGADDVVRAEADFVHVVASPVTEAAAAICDAARRSGVPYAVSFGAPPIAGEPWWAMQTLAYVGMINAETEINDGYLRSFAQRALVIGERVERAPAALANAVEAMRAALAGAHAVIAVTAGEERAIRETYGFGGRIDIAPPLIGAEPAQASLAGVLPSRPFVLVHAPIDRNANLMLVAQALAADDIALVVAGDVVDVDQYETLREYAPDDCTIVPSPTPGMEAALYGHAAVFLDASWCPSSPFRALRAALRGAAPVVAWNSYAAELLGPDAWFVDPANRATIRAAVRTAMHDPQRHERAARLAERLAALPDPFLAMANAYASPAALA